ncbi:PREDICTED: putative F-box protein At4g11580 [Brassica oleracea var. oleracea]|uniref:putative F-box protein At4g11580 n=1 Tax=Brassica oleracea var. oleracea TaxID=109376 RepID=UPI0006A6AA79|nr:PREDICTED: putative F-box protein At4g11580 [Brassica oleracea var. oleracea]
MDKDMLVNIFKKLDVVDVIMGASRVCITWFLASHNKTIWNTIKFNDTDSIVVDNTKQPTRVGLLDNNNGEKHRYQLREILIEINKFSRAAPVEFFFNVNSNVLEEDLAIISNGLPNIRKLALPIQETQNLNSLASSFSKWKNLKTLIIAKFANNDDLNHEFKTIAENCRNLTTIKLAYRLDHKLANIILGKLPNLERLSLRCTSVSIKAVKLLIIGLQNLKSLNLSHCLFTKPYFSIDVKSAIIGMSRTDELVQLGTQKLENFKVCFWDCTICLDVWKGSSDPRYYSNYEYKQWETDEIEEFEF